MDLQLRLNIAHRLWERNEHLDRMVAANYFELIRRYLRDNPNEELRQQLPLGWQ